MEKTAQQGASYFLFSANCCCYYYYYYYYYNYYYLDFTDYTPWTIPIRN